MEVANPRAIDIARITASISRSSPDIISPHRISRRELVICVPGIYNITSPINTLSRLSIKPVRPIKRARTPSRNVQKKLYINILIPRGLIFMSST